MIETKYYTCEYCFKEYTPKRRRVQKFCSNSCRSSSHRLRKSKEKEKDETLPTPTTKTEVPQVPNPDKISVVGVGNAALGALAADGVKSIFTSRKNKPATKGDIDLLIEKLGGRYHLIKNIPPNIHGENAYYDLQEGIFVYLKTF
ncbi:hypothetical protein [Winogradskyella ouciana]|uniref:Uncharacterized protein n=1 Tax=Winogradskyella ouciana TaxID=2608631 RepID=A0A7K1GGF9_9FLAO|nr:hypothetical protein [Winogradskyella ouciana]MTE27554.1 hypothetical protein [Winogradskyella ouciana]